MNVFVKNSSNELLVGRVWPDLTVYPDFLHPNATLYWQQQIQLFRDNISFDGLWLDMNEPSNFVPGSVYGCDNRSSLDHPPYLPGQFHCFTKSAIIKCPFDTTGALKGSGILHKTLCMSAKQYISSHYDVHSLYGHSEAKATMK